MGLDTLYSENLRSILRFTQGRHLLRVRDVMLYTGLADARSAKRRYPFVGGCISAETLALLLSGGEDE